MEHKEPSTPQGRVAVAFAAALVSGDFAGARELLAPELRGLLSPDDLREELYEMFSYAEVKPQRFKFHSPRTTADWPGKSDEDVSWEYVGIEGDGNLEAVDLLVSEREGRLVIRDIIWGRP
jgi:hypothetical protein